MGRFFSTKAGTLAQLQGVLRCARILPLVRFTVGDWQADRADCLARVKRDLPAPWIVRSSCTHEDAIGSSKAGRFLSIQNVTESSLTESVRSVVNSYGSTSADDEVLIQPMLHNVLRSGVAFSHDPNTCGPYRIINWIEGADTAAVTGGKGGRVWQGAAASPVPPPPIFVGILALIEELLGHFEGVPLDCEFAVTQDGNTETLWLLQVRPLIMPYPPESPEIQAARLQLIRDKVARGLQTHPFLMGQRTAYGVMPDWNPAEIIGIRPRPLALSLYRELVTDAIWAYQRHNYGYRNLRSFPLMPHFFGLPYIDVRLSFNSFIPADLDESLAGRLVDHYLDRLLAEPMLHDKVEFEIVFSCYTLDLPLRLEALARAGFSAAERTSLADSLRNLTRRIVDSRNGLWREDAAKLDQLAARRTKLLTAPTDPLENIYWLLEDAKRYGTLPFAGLARAGFIAVQMLRSLVAVGIFTAADADAFMGSLATVSGHLARDRATLPRKEFLSRYGHLRPGTYDILSPRYDSAPDAYFDWDTTLPNPPPAPARFAMTQQQGTALARLLGVHGLPDDPEALLAFLRAGIELRELAKFHFSRNLSDVLERVSEYGAAHGFSREDMSYCEIGALRELHVAAADPRETLARSIATGRERYAETMRLSLPPLIVQSDDVWHFEWSAATPNFITQKQVTAVVAPSLARETLSGAIVCIPSADPGFDWLFAYPIAGLITAWGGANSHMAIRAGELGLPAVIGAGEMLYRRWSSARHLQLDCAGRRVEVLP